MDQSKQGENVGNAQITQYVVRIPKDKNKKFHLMRFNHSLKVDVTKWKQIKMERENNYKEFKLDDDTPKYGAGSEFGRDLKEEARRKKHGIMTKQYNPEDQPWILKTGGKGGKKFKGIREGGVTENASYYVFTQSTDGTFEAYPVEEWYNFTPIQCFKALSAEEAEEEFGRRDKVLNYFSIMVKKRLQPDNVEDDDDEEKKQNLKKKKKKVAKEFQITDMDEWANEVSSDESENENDDEDKPAKKKKPEKKKNKEKKKKQKGSESEDEALEESDEGDFEEREVDYITSSSSDGEEEEKEDEKANRQLKGVEDEEALRKLMSDDDEEEEETENNKEAEETPEAKEKVAENKPKQKKKSDSSGESSSESSDSDFDDPKFTSAIFAPNFQKSKKKNGSDNSAGSSRANTPTKQHNKEGIKSQKRKMPESSPSASPSPKKIKTEPQPTVASTLDCINEESVRRYLRRKPMTASELLHKFKSKKTKMSSDQLVNKIADVLKKMDLQKTNVKGKMYLSLKQK